MASAISMLAGRFALAAGRAGSQLLMLGLIVHAVAGCAATPQANVLGYYIERWLGTLDAPQPDVPGGMLEGRVVDADGNPIANAAVVLAERRGTPHTARTDATGHYRIADVPPDSYAVSAVAPGYDEATLPGLLAAPGLATLRSGENTVAPDLPLSPYAPPALPAELAAAVNLRQTDTFTATAPFPDGAVARVRAYAFDFNGAVVDSLRLYLPAAATPADTYPLVLFVAPTAIDDWQNVSVGFASQGYAVVGISPIAAREVDPEAHAQDARVALELARTGALGPEIGDNRPVAMGGSYSSAILARLLRSAGQEIAGWITVGGLANAFTVAAAYYRGEVELPPDFSLLVPALGWPSLNPLAFLRFSPVYVAGELPPTLVIHTEADRVLPIQQAEELTAALRMAHVPVDTYYYSDVSHYLGIGENLTDAGREMFYRIIEFIDRYGSQGTFQ